MTSRIFKAVSAVTIALLTVLAIGCGDRPAANSSAGDPAMAKLVAEYPLKTCVVTGKALGDMGKPHDVLYEGKLVRFCCSSCVKEFNTDPAGYVAKIDQARAARRP